MDPMNGSRTSNLVLAGTVMVAAVMFLSLLAGSGVQVLRGFNPLDAIGSIFQGRATAGGLRVALRSGEQATAATVSEADALLAAHGVIAPTFEDVLTEVDSCVRISDESDAQVMILCAPATYPEPGTEAAAGSFDLMVPLLTDRADALMRNPELTAVTVAKFDTSLAEHRKLLIEQGTAVLDFVTEYDLSGIAFAGLTLDRSEGSEWLGYADVGGVRHVAWAWGPDEAALAALLTR